MLYTPMALNKVIPKALTLVSCVRTLYTGLCGGEYSYFVTRLSNTGAQATKLYVVRTKKAPLNKAPFVRLVKLFFLHS